MGFLKSIKDAVFGETLSQIDTRIGYGVNVSLRVKKEGEGRWVSMVTGVPGEVTYYRMSAKQFEEFAEAVEATRQALKSQSALAGC